MSFSKVVAAGVGTVWLVGVFAVALSDRFAHLVLFAPGWAVTLAAVSILAPAVPAVLASGRDR